MIPSFHPATLVLAVLMQHTAFAKPSFNLQSTETTQTETLTSRLVHQAADLPTLVQRQITPNGTCPNTGRECPLGGRCCPRRCCSYVGGYCSDVADVCVTSQGWTLCLDEDDSSTYACSPCKVATEKLASFAACPYQSKYRFCTANAPFRCVSENGFIPCPLMNGTVAEGVECGDTCCPLPQQCSPSGTCVLSGGTSEPRKIEKAPSVSPGSVPFAPENENDASPEPTVTSDPSEPSAGVPDSSNSPGPSPGSEATTSSESSSCFPASATVELVDGEIVTMRELRTGDRVRVSGTEFSAVIMWTHRDASFRGGSYVRLSLKDGRGLTATLGHLVPVCRQSETGCVREVVQIEEIGVGDGVWVVQDRREVAMEVVKSDIIDGIGLFNPQTMHGDVIVDGVLATCYTKTVPVQIAHSALAPVRAVFEVLHAAVGSRVWFF